MKEFTASQFRAAQLFIGTIQKSRGNVPTSLFDQSYSYLPSYLKADGSKVTVTMTPVTGYIDRLVILEDGTYQTGIIGDFSD